MIKQSARGIAGRPRKGSHLGGSLLSISLGRGRADDLAVGAPDRAVHSEQNAGAVLVLNNGRQRRPTATSLITEDTRGIRDAAESLDGFGRLGGNEWRLDGAQTH
jgi:hypothetical protein